MTLMAFLMDVMSAYYPAVRTRFTRTLHGAGASHPRGGAGAPTVAMLAIECVREVLVDGLLGWAAQQKASSLKIIILVLFQRECIVLWLILNTKQ